MLIDLTRVRCLFMGACLLACSPLLAFEPGTERTCEPSADGERFVCRDASGQIEEPAEQTPAPVTNPSTAAAPEPQSTPEPEATPPSDAVPSSTSKLPNYLLQNPGSAPRRAAAAPASPPAAKPRALQSAPTAPAEVPPKASMAEPPAPAEVVPAGAMSPATSEPATNQEQTAPVDAPARTQSRPATATSPRPAATANPAPAKPAPPSGATAGVRSDPASAAMPPGQRPLLDAAAFMKLPGSHYTLVLDSARSSTEFNALVTALEDLPGNLYLVGLNMPDGRWYSLCWSHFDSLDAARAARAELPADAPIASGWPRRISLLQSEIK